MITEEAAPQQTNATLQEIIAREDAVEQAGPSEEKPEVEAETETGRKRLLDMNREEFRERTGTVLGKVAQGAGDALGIKTNVKKTETDERETKHVTVKFGPIKFKRVKNKKR